MNEPRLTRKQQSALASCHWTPCPFCGQNVPIIRAVGSPCAGFDSYHMAECASLWERYPRRTCRTLHHCKLCDTHITLGEAYFDGGYGKRAHVECVVFEKVKVWW